MQATLLQNIILFTLNNAATAARIWELLPQNFIKEHVLYQKYFIEHRQFAGQGRPRLSSCSLPIKLEITEGREHLV